VNVSSRKQFLIAAILQEDTSLDINFENIVSISVLSMFRQAQHDKTLSAFVILSLSKDAEGGF